MTTARTSFIPGDWAAVCGPAAWLLVKLPFDDARISRLYETLSAGSEVDAVLDLLVEGGVSAAPPFACVALGDGDARVVVRHPAVATVTNGDETVVHTPADGTTWTDVLAPATSVLLQSAAETASGVRLPLHGGITPASALVIGLQGVSVPAAGPGTEAAATPDPTPESEPEPEPEILPVPDPEPEPEDESLAKRRQTFVGLLTSDTTDRDALLAQLNEDPDDAQSPPEESAEATDTDAPAAASQPNPMTAVWQVDEAPPAPDLASAPDAGAGAGAGDEPATEPEAPAPASSSGGLIDGVPWLSGGMPSTPAPAQRPTFVSPERVDAPLPPPSPTPAPAPAPTPAPAPAVSSAPGHDPESDNPTVSRADLMKSLGSAGVVGPSVLAVTCPNGHATAPAEPACRLCGSPVEDQEPSQIPRPPLGALVLGSGDRLVLDKDAILGRAPTAPEGTTERPHLLRVGDSGEISRQHARIILDGWHVIVRDLGTANGTTLTLPDGSPQQLRANEDYQLEDGAEIGIADLVTLRYEVKP